MDFGRLPNIDAVDFTLPKEHAGNVNVLPGFLSEESFISTGSPIWAEKGWLGKIYPKGTKEKDYLRFYAEKFSAIELNATHYTIPDSNTLLRWRAAVPEHFRFCPKIPQTISHAKDIVQMTEQMLHFITVLRTLENNLGTSFLQLPQHFGPDKLKSLLYFLNALPEDFSLAIEFRQADWFKDKRKFDKIFNYLEDRKFCTVITDVAGRRDLLHLRLSNRTAFIRFAANDLHPSDFARIDEWSMVLKKWLSEGLKEIYFFIHTPNKALFPELANYFSQKMNKTSIELPFKDQFKQGNLFE
ncbi:MAG TPA: DUF72 domain-containing protein [Cytophagaceae bacterium]|jgi:uncharacterized protein YecE (DUF72 family)|nr:DUF72 domain-containing protein [Cytophagaceae bacterium]